MKYLLFILFAFLSFGFTYSQDIIVTNQGDSVDCKITKVTDTYVHFTVFDGTGLVLTRSRLPLSEIASYVQSEESEESENPTNSEIKREDLFVLDSYAVPRFRLSIDGGFTYQFAGYDGFPPSYKNQVQTLWGFGGEIDYFIARSKFGIGLKYYYSFTEANDDLLLIDGTVLEVRDELIQFNFAGASVLLRKISADDQLIHFYLMGGLLFYQTSLTINGDPLRQEGDTFGAGFGVNYDYRLSERVGVGVGLELLIAQLSQITVNGVTQVGEFDVSRINLTVGLRFYK